LSTECPEGVRSILKALKWFFRITPSSNESRGRGKRSPVLAASIAGLIGALVLTVGMSLGVQLSGATATTQSEPAAREAELRRAQGPARLDRLLGAAPIEGRISGVVDIPNACCSLYLPTAIFDFDIQPTTVGPVRADRGSCAVSS
jgi:hypothetical protein